MAKIIYKRGKEGQNNLSSIKGIEIDLLNGQKALIYPKYDERQMLTSEQISKWDAAKETEIEALKKTSTALETECLREIGSPSAQWVSQFKYAKYSNFALPSFPAAMEIQDHQEEIDTLAETIEGADLLRYYTSGIWSCSRSGASFCRYVDFTYGYAGNCNLSNSCLVVPTILYR